MTYMLNKIEYILINFGYLVVPDTPRSMLDKRSLLDYLSVIEILSSRMESHQKAYETIIWEAALGNRWICRHCGVGGVYREDSDKKHGSFYDRIAKNSKYWIRKYFCF